MLSRFIRTLIIALLISIFILVMAVPVMAFEERSGTNVTIGSGEVVNGDLYLTATNITIDGTVNGDVFGLGQTVNINGTINGGITLAAQTITVNGKVFAGARIAGQTITIGGSIGRDLIAAASDLNINANAVVNGDLILVCSAFNMSGHIAGNIRGSADSFTISGKIDKNVDVTVNTLQINSTANIGGNLSYTSKNKAAVQSGAIINGTTNQIIPSQEGIENFVFAGIVGSIAFKIFSYLAIFIIGIVLIFTILRRLKLLALTIQRQPGPCLGWGALIFFITPLAAFIVMLTVIGIPLGLLSMAVWGILVYLSQIPVALIIGWLILSRNRDIRSHALLVGALALGLFILYLLTCIPIVGWIIWLFIFFFGLGSLVSVFRSKPRDYEVL
jgi:cytoskeletal protein CcmA (bactofilin family)